MVVNAFDGAIHFLDAETGEPILPKFQTGDLAKGSVTIDPDGFPLVYAGSRDQYRDPRPERPLSPPAGPSWLSYG